MHRAADGRPVTERPDFVVSGDQQRVLQSVYDLWRPQARWPLYGPLDATMDHEHNIELGPILATMPEDLMIFTRIPAVSDDSEVKLTIVGISMCDGSHADVDLFVQALRWCVRRQREHRPDPKNPTQLQLTSQDAARDWAADGADVSQEVLIRAFSLLTTENIAWGSGCTNTEPVEWQIGIHRDIRKYRPVQTLEDYLRIKTEAMSVSRPSSPPFVVPRTRIRHNAAFELFSSGIIEPEPSLALAELHSMIREAATPFFAAGHHRQAVLDAGLALRDLVRTKSGLAETNDSTLMGKAFGGKRPLIQVADLSVPTGQNIQRGIAHLAEAIIAAVRNRLTHESVEIPVAEAMEMLAMMSHLLRLVDEPWRPPTAPSSEDQKGTSAGAGLPFQGWRQRVNPHTDSAPPCWRNAPATSFSVRPSVKTSS